MANTDGGQAFPGPRPRPRYSGPPDNCYIGDVFAEGMTLCDYFAAAAMQGLLVNGRRPSDAICGSWEIADRMIQQGEK